MRVYGNVWGNDLIIIQFPVIFVSLTDISVRVVAWGINNTVLLYFIYTHIGIKFLNDNLLSRSTIVRTGTN